MKKYLLALLLPMFCIGSFAQEKLFKEALANGHQPGKFYHAVNNKSKSLKVADVREYADRMGYILGSIDTKTVSRFGDVATTVASFDFLPQGEYIDYLYYHIRPDVNIGLQQLTKKGSAYCYLKRDGKTTYFWKCNNISWNGEVVNGMLNGSGIGYGKVSDALVVCFRAKFYNGMPVGTNSFQWYNISGKPGPYSSSNLSAHTAVAQNEFSDGLAWVKVNGLYGFVNLQGQTAIPVKFKSVVNPFANGQATVTNETEEIIINTSGVKVDLSPRQKKIYADIKAEEERKAEAARQAELEKERARILAEKKAEEERQAAAAAELALQKRIEANKNTKLWSRGCRLAYRYPNGKEYVLATLEEWNETRTRVKVKIVASPSATRTLNGDLLEKGNTMWVSAHNEGWHLALDEEISIALGNDHSIKPTPSPSYSSGSSSSGRSYSDCSTCRGRGRVACSSCDGTGTYHQSGWSEDRYETCSSCNGSGWKKCYSCNGTGRR